MSLGGQAGPRGKGKEAQDAKGGFKAFLFSRFLF
jgi:hypothetical protein